MPEEINHGKHLECNIDGFQQNHVESIFLPTSFFHDKFPQEKLIKKLQGCVFAIFSNVSYDNLTEVFVTLFRNFTNITTRF